MRVQSLLPVVLSSLALSFSALGATQEAAIAQAIKSKIEANFPNVKVDSVARSPFAGLYEVVTNGQLAYVSEDASLLFAGKILDTRTKEDLTTKRWNEINRIDFAELPLESALKSVKGDGTRTLVIFADPLCPYCRQLEQQLSSMTDVTVYTMLLPLEGIHPGATQLAERIWCASDRAAVWTQWMVNQIEPAAEKCDPSPLSSIRDLAERLKINSTPTLYFADGHRLSGALDKEQLEREFTLAKSKVVQSGAKTE